MGLPVRDTSPPQIRRHTARQSVVISSGATASETVDASQHAFGVFHLPGTFTGASVTFETSPDGGTTWQAIHDADNAVISQAVTAGKSYAIPSRVMHAETFRIVSAGAEGADRTIVVDLKG